MIESIVSTLNSPNLLLVPEVIRWVVWALATLFYVLQPKFRMRVRFLNGLCYRYLALAGLFLFAFFAALETWIQYYVWRFDPFSEKFLPPHQPWIRFLFYSFQRFWLGVILSIVIAFAFYLFLKVLQKYRGRFFEEGETELGLALSFIVGWPHFVVFLPLTFVFVVLLSFARRIFLKRAYTTLGFPMIFAAAVMLFWSEEIFAFFKLSTLQVCLSCLGIQ